MNERILKYAEDLFKDAPPKRRIFEMREELTADMNDKFNDYVGGGMSENEAFQSVVEGIGDIGGLIDDIEQMDRDGVKERKRDTAALVPLLRAIAIGLYIFGMVAAIFCDAVLAFGDVSILIAMCIWAVATALLVYAGSISKKKKYVKEDDTFVEGYKEKISGGSDKNSRMHSAASSSLWLFIVIIYLALSFTSWQWHITWVIFLVGAVLQQILSAFFTRKLNLNGIIWTSTVIVYFIVSFTFGNWQISWVIFLVGAAIQQAVRFYNIWREE